MTTKRNNHLLKNIAKLQNLSKKISNPFLDQKDIRTIHEDLIVALNSAVLKNAKQYLIDQKETSIKALENLSHEALETINNIELITKRSIVKKNLKLEASCSNEKLPESEYLVINEMLKLVRLLALYQQANLLANDTSTIKAMWLLRLPELEKKAENILKSFPSITAWLNEYTSLQILTNQLDIINAMIKFDSKEIDNEIENLMIIYIQMICKYFIDQLMTTHNLVFTKIEKIYYKYFPRLGKKKAKIILYINDKNITFEGDTATLLKIALDNPLDALEIDSIDFENAILDTNMTILGNKKLSDNLYRKVEKINTKISLDSSLLEFGILSFLKMKDYEIRLNSQYYSYIVKN